MSILSKTLRETVSQPLHVITHNGEEVFGFVQNVSGSGKYLVSFRNSQSFIAVAGIAEPISKGDCVTILMKAQPVIINRKNYFKGSRKVVL